MTSIRLAPMAGITDWPFRVLCFEQGCDVATTEMVSAMGYLYAPRNHPATVSLIERRDSEGKLLVQIFGKEADLMARAAEELSAMGRFDGVDVNMGCPAHKVAASGEGSGLMRTPENIIDGAYRYIVIIFWGIPVTYLYNLVSGIIRSMGDSRTPVVFLVIAAVINIGLDLFFIVVLGTGVEGAAWATVISQLISGVGCLIYSIRHFEILHPEKEEMQVNKTYMMTLCGMGVPMGLQYSITAIGSVILQSAVNSLGSHAVAAMTAGSKIGMFFCCPFDALGSTMATYGGQNVGAKKLDRVSGGLKAASILGCAYAVLAFVIMIFFRGALAGFFVGEAEPEVVSNAGLFLLINSAFYIPLAFVNIVRFLIQGMGYSKFAILAGVFEMVARTLVGFAFVPVFGYVAACFASPVAWIFADAFLFPAYFHVLKKTKKMLYK